MNQETQAAPVAEAENTATESTQAEVVTPQTEQKTEPQASDKDDRDKSIARLERRINRKHAEFAAANERARMLEDRLAQYERNRPEEERQKVEVDPEEFQRAVKTTAHQLAEQTQLQTRIDKIISEGQEKFSDFDRLTSVMTDELPIMVDGKRTPAMEAILDCDDPAAVIAHLGNNPDVAASLNGLSISRVARRLEQIERDIKQPPKPSAAPKPHEPERSGSSSSMPDPERDLRGWMEARNKQEAQRRNR